MKVGMLANDEKLQDSVKSRFDASNEEWSFYGRVEAAEAAVREGGFDYFVVSDRLFDYDGLSEWTDEIKEYMHTANMVILLSNHHDPHENERLLKLCLSRDLHFVRPGRSLSGVVEEIRRHIHGQVSDSKKSTTQMITFVGTTPNIGTTIISFGSAFRLALETERSVGYLCLNLKSSKLHRYVGRDDPHASLDALRTDLRAASLTPERLRQYCTTFKEAPRLGVLFGNLIREHAEFYTPEEVEHLLHIAERTFDVCIIEVNAYWDNAATVIGMLRAHRRIAVSTEELAHFQEDMERWLKTMSLIYGMNVSSFDLVLTQQETNSSNNQVRMRDIRRETEMEIIGKISRYANVQEYLNEGRLMEMLLSSHPINRELGRLSHTLATLCGLPKLSIEAKKGGHRKWRLGLSGST